MHLLLSIVYSLLDLTYKGQNSLENTEPNFSLFLGIEHKIYSGESGYFRYQILSFQANVLTQ